MCVVWCASSSSARCAHALDPFLRERRRFEETPRALDRRQRRGDRVRDREARGEGGHGYSSPRKARCWSEAKSASSSASDARCAVCQLLHRCDSPGEFALQLDGGKRERSVSRELLDVQRRLAHGSQFVGEIPLHEIGGEIARP